MIQNRSAVDKLLYLLVFALTICGTGKAQDAKKGSNAQVCDLPVPSRSRAIAQTKAKPAAAVKTAGEKSCCVRTPSRFAYHAPVSASSKKGTIVRQ